jgi:DNA-binding transcriptional regulator YhcF (GntR family)
MNRTDRHYADMADTEEGRDHTVKDKYGLKAVVSEGAFGRAWLKFNPGAELVYVNDAEGRPRALTPKQYLVLVMALDIIRGAQRMTMRDMAAALEVAPSTISRALTKLASWGLIGYIVGRGRWAGLVIFRRAKDDGMERFRKAARERVARWKKAAEARVSRLWINVAPYIQGESGTTITSYRDSYYLTTSKGATLTAQLTWTPDELREAGII